MSFSDASNTRSAFSSEQDATKSKTQLLAELTSLKEALNAISDAIIFFDPDDRIAGFNKKQIELFPSVAEDLQPGLAYRDLLRKQVEGGQIDKAIGREEAWIQQRIKQHQDPDSYPIEQKFADGRIIRLTESRTSSGGYVALRTDITELRLAQEALRVNEERYRRLFDFAGVAIWDEDLTDVAGRMSDLREAGIVDLRKHLENNTEEAFGLARLIRINSVNDATLALYGVESREDFIADFEKLISVETIGSFIDVMCAIWNGDEQYLSEISHKNMKGEDMTILLVIPIPKGDWMHVPVCAIDITARKQVETEVRIAKKAAQAADRAKSEFLANMSHELRTPLNAIIGFSSIIKDQTFGPEAAEKYIEYAGDIFDSGGYLLNIINDILDLSKIESGSAVLVEEPVQIASVIETAFRVVSDRASNAGVILTAPVERADYSLLGDSRMITQIMLNLLTNAIKFTPREGEVRVSVGETDTGGIEISVVDTGAGMTDEEIPLALSTFGQTADAVNKAIEGTGLGLPIVTSLVELHGGEFCLKSEPGKGTDATVRFPVKRSINQP
jgi:signal transduction histidine kinase